MSLIHMDQQKHLIYDRMAVLHDSIINNHYLHVTDIFGSQLLSKDLIFFQKHSLNPLQKVWT